MHIDIISNDGTCEDGISNGRITKLEYDFTLPAVFVFFSWTGDPSCGNPDNIRLSCWVRTGLLGDTALFSDKQYTEFDNNHKGWYVGVLLSEMTSGYPTDFLEGAEVYFSIRVSTAEYTGYTEWSSTSNPTIVSLDTPRRLTGTVPTQLDSSRPSDSLALATSDDANAAASRQLQASTSCTEATVGLDAGAASFESGLGEVVFDFSGVPGVNLLLEEVVLMDPTEIATVQVTDNYDTGVQMDACTGTSQTPSARNAGVGSDGDGSGDGDGSSSSPVGAIVGALVAVVVLAGIGAAGYYVLVVRSPEPAPTPAGSA